VLINLKNNAKSDYTIKFVDKALRRLNKYADLDNPEQVKQFIAQMDTSDSYKKIYVTHTNSIATTTNSNGRNPHTSKSQRQYAYQPPHN
jgi:hypothetical protein